MEPISRISALLEKAQELTLDAASAARTSRNASRPMDRNQIKKLVDSRNEREVLEGLRKVISMMYRTQKTLPFFSSVVKNVASPNIEIKKLVYIYLIHHAEQEPDLALLSINTIQKSLSDSNPQVRALALKTMSGIRVPVISQIVSLAIKKGVGDMSPYVRRAAAMAIPKCFRLDPNQAPQLIEYLSTLLGDKQYFVAGAAVTAFMEICPERIDLIHKHYRGLARKVVDMDEWSQLSTLGMMTIYARKCFPRRTRAATSAEKANLQEFYGEAGTDGEATEQVIVVDPDLELLLNAIKPLLQSRNSGVVVAVARCYVSIGTPEYIKYAVGPLVALLRGPTDIQQVVLYNIVSVCLLRPKDFVRYASHFLVRATDSGAVWELKLEVLTLIFPHAPPHVKSLILNELEHFSSGSDKMLVREAVRAIGRCAQSDPATSSRCLKLLLSQITSLDGTLAAESLTVIRHLIQQDPTAHTSTVVRLAKNLDSATDPQARATIIWLVGEFAGLHGEDNIAADVLRILLKNFAEESEIAKRQIVLLAAKVYLHLLNRVEEHPVARLWNYVLLLVRYDTSYDLRDRTRLFKALVAVPQLATLMLLAPKPAPQAPSPSETRKGFTLGSAALVLAGGGGVHGLRGYEALPDWVEEGREPDPRLRSDGEATQGYGYGEKRAVPAADSLDSAAARAGIGKATNEAGRIANLLQYSSRFEMWLIDTSSLKLKEILELQDCKYAILSHTWEEDEVNFQEMKAEPRLTSLLTKAGYLKIKKTCEVAREKGYDYAWVDTCCIDKESSAALSEAINSMYSWYKESSICLAYLSDLPANNFEHAESRTADFMKDCKWFRRGWTLQELVAPEELEFYDQEWKFRGSKKTLRHELSNITGIDVDILEDSELLPTIPVGRRMSWAAARKTTRVEDIAYCLLGIFGVNMAMIYGENKNAFFRLQEEIVKSTNDLTLFAWTSQDGSGIDRRPTHQSQHGKDLRGILAQSPAEFVGCGRLKISRDRIAPAKDFAMTNNGLRIETTLGSSPDKEYIFALDCVNESRRQERLGIYLMKTESGFVRDRAYELFATTDKAFWTGHRSTIYIARNLSNSLALRLRAQLLRSLNFYFHLSPRSTYSYKDFKARPASLWDNNGKLFLTGNRQNFTAMIEFTLRPRYWRFVIVCGLIDTKSEKPQVTDLWDEGESTHNGVAPWMAIFTDQDPLAKPQLEIIDKLKNGNDELWKLRQKVLSWYVDGRGRLPLRKMAEKLHTAFDDHGEISYTMDMVKGSNQKGTPVFNIRVFVSEVTRVRDASSTMANLGTDEEGEQHLPPRQPPEWVPPVPQPPPAIAPELNPFIPQPHVPPPQRHYSDAYAPGYGRGRGPSAASAPYPHPQYANTVPHASAGPAYPRPDHTTRQWTYPASHQQHPPPGSGYGYGYGQDGRGRPPGYG
ncbi:hypothetical protein VMCG_05120 [Cytospora schulzeri]|uniref:Clathrin/coatomer adaptor adaptin-like N-terminal domain-containing protein n=1 Tax=Cytospora schulzeri TaxID=448051 RepID=A0A423WML7_9PEZI|nr:hypothetical protein VMCG_05120 [Valsa malicola]